MARFISPAVLILTAVPTWISMCTSFIDRQLDHLSEFRLDLLSGCTE